MTSRIRPRHLVAAGVPVALVAGAVLAPGVAVAAPKMAEALHIQMDSDNAGVTAQGQTQAKLGDTYHITGQRWCFGNHKTGQWIGVKLIDAEDENGAFVVTKGDAAMVTQPDGTKANLGGRGVIAMLKADDDPAGAGNCTLDATVTLPTTANSDATDERFPQGATRSIVLLAGSFGPGTTSGGQAPHGGTLNFVVGDPVEDTPEPTTTEPTTTEVPDTTTATATATDTTTYTTTVPTTVTTLVPTTVPTTVTTAVPTTVTSLVPTTVNNTVTQTVPSAVTTTMVPTTVTSTVASTVPTTVTSTRTTVVTSTVGQTSTPGTSPATSVPAVPGDTGSLGGGSFPSIGLLGVLGIGGFIAGVLAGLFTPILSILGIR